MIVLYTDDFGLSGHTDAVLKVWYMLQRELTFKDVEDKQLDDLVGIESHDRGRERLPAVGMVTDERLVHGTTLDQRADDPASSQPSPPMCPCT